MLVINSLFLYHSYMRISCIMPTYNRERFIARSINCFLNQDYADKELVIINDGNNIANLVPILPNIRVLTLDKKTVLGEKRNIGIQLSSGDYIAMWDDDDWSASNRLSFQLEALQKDLNKTICGLSSVYYHDIQTNEVYLFSYPGKQYLVDGTALFKRSAYKPFPQKQVAATVDFINTIPENHQLYLNRPELYLATKHDTNTSEKKIIPLYWKKTTLKVEDIIR